MAHVIKSNSKLNNPANAVGNIHSYYGAPDYVGMLDFSNGIYKVNGVKKSLTDVIAVDRNSEASYLNIFREFKTVGNNEARITYIPELGESGLLVEYTRTNFVTSDENGAAFTAINSKSDIYISWEGDGTVAPAAELTLRREFKEGGRTHRFYNRSGEVTSNIVVTGTVSKVMVTNSSRVVSYIEPLKAAPSDIVTLAGQLKTMLSGGKGTILCRIVLPENNGFEANDFYIAAANPNAVGGGVLVAATFRKTVINTADVVVLSDNALRNSGVQQARILGNTNKIAIVGLTFSGNGANTGIISYGQAGFGNTTVSPVTPPTALTEFYLGTAPTGMLSNQTTRDVVITHCVVYDRILTAKEASDAAFFGH